MKEADLVLRRAIEFANDVEKGLYQADAMAYPWSLVSGQPYVRGITIFLEDLVDIAPGGVTEGVFALKLEVNEEDDPRTMLGLACEEAQLPKVKGFKLGNRYVGQCDDAAALSDASLDAATEFPLPMQNRRLPHPRNWQVLIDKLYSWLDEDERHPRYAEIQALDSIIEGGKTLPQPQLSPIASNAASSSSATSASSAAAASSTSASATSSQLSPRSRTFDDLSQTARDYRIGEGKLVGLFELHIIVPVTGKLVRMQLCDPRWTDKGAKHGGAPRSHRRRRRRGKEKVREEEAESRRGSHACHRERRRALQLYVRPRKEVGSRASSARPKHSST